MAVLRGDADAPVDLREKSLMLAGRILEFDPDLRRRRACPRAGLARFGCGLAAMEAIIAAQGPPPVRAVLGSLTYEVVANQDGDIKAIDCFRIARIAPLPGRRTDPGAGLDLFHRIGDHVRKGTPLYRIHAEDPADFATACQAARQDSGIAVAPC